MVKLYYSNERSLPWEREQDSTRNFHFQICLLGLQWQIIYKLQKVRGFWFCCWSSLLFRFHSGMEKWRSWWWWDSTHWCGCFILSFSYFLCLHLPVPSQLWLWLMSFFNWTRREYATLPFLLPFPSLCFIRWSPCFSSLPISSWKYLWRQHTAYFLVIHLPSSGRVLPMATRHYIKKPAN